jgi:hypothetical protein
MVRARPCRMKGAVPQRNADVDGGSGPAGGRRQDGAPALQARSGDHCPRLILSATGRPAGSRGAAMVPAA